MKAFLFNHKMRFLLRSISFLFLVSSFLNTFASSPTQHLCHPDQRDALLELKTELLVDPDADACFPFPKTESWVKKNNCCSWNGITCDKSGKVIRLDLSASCLHGQLESNTSLFRLRHLRELNLAVNNVFGEFPSSVLLLPNLEYIILDNNRNLGGNLPVFRENNSLLSLSIYDTAFSGIIPDSISNLKYLTSLILSSSNFSGKIPFSLGNLSNLSRLSLSSNNFVGEIPSSIGNLKQLTSFDVSGNKLSGNLPTTVRNLNQLDTLDLSFNQFTVDLNVFSQLKQLQRLDLSGIPLSTANITSDSDFPSHLYLRGCNIAEFPEFIRYQGNLKTLYLSNNKIKGLVPDWLWRLPELFDVDLSNNSFSGFNGSLEALPESHIGRINLSSNAFHGPLDLNFFAPLKQLQTLSLSGIPLSTENITSGSAFPSDLNVLELRGCNITEFPGFTRYQRTLTHIDISDNNIKGQVPDWLWRLPELGVVLLSNNSLTGFNGSLEASPGSQIVNVDLRSNAFQGPLFIPSMSLSHFLASKNNFTGEIPRSLCGQSILSVLDLSNNNLHGSVPRCFGESLMSSLSDLNLSNNSLSGSLPEIFMNAKALWSFDISHNRIKGKLPASLTSCSDLEVLNVGSNKINDLFPFRLKSLQKLQVLVLRSNKFNGTLHNADEVWSGFPLLKIIDVSHNDFLGSLPSDYFLNWTAMSSKRDNNTKLEYIANPKSASTSPAYYSSLVLTSKGVSLEMERILKLHTAIDFSGNQLHGQIPDSIGLLKELRNINMSSNAFTGHIPSSLANLTNLESLDLSQNKISGEIPPEIGTLSSLARINVSHNQLVGSIPQGTQFQTQNCSSYEGNPGLHGPSLKDVCGDTKAPTPSLETEEEEEEESLSWIAAGIGFAPGVVFGLTMGYIVASYKHEWFMKTFGRSKQQRTRTH